jgi:outer membrane receptor protein involved in Fe transport
MRYAGLFFQDDWRVSRHLMLNLGLRWDSDRPLTERFDRTSWFDFQALLPRAVPGLGPLRGGLVFAGQNGAPRGNKDPDNNNFAPRIGFAYSVTPRLVLRPGFGIMYVPSLDNGPTAANTGALTFNAFTPYISDIDGGRTPFTNLSNVEGAIGRSSVKRNLPRLAPFVLPRAQDLIRSQDAGRLVQRGVVARHVE